MGKGHAVILQTSSNNDRVQNQIEWSITIFQFVWSRSYIPMNMANFFLVPAGKKHMCWTTPHFHDFSSEKNRLTFCAGDFIEIYRDL